MIGAVIDKDVNNRLAGTVCANTAAILNGADIIRVHDIKEGIDTVKIADYILKAYIWLLLFLNLLKVMLVL